MSKLKDITGQRFGRLLVVARAANTARGRARFDCLCDCGVAKTIISESLLAGHTKSCGCWRAELPSIAFRTHGQRRTPEYRIWSHIKTRCLNPRSRFFHRYGGRGIGVCPAWAASFEAFLADMGPRPTAKHSVDRIDNDGGYAPLNCRWALPATQSANRSTVRRIEHMGIVDSLTGWSRRSGVAYLKLRRRLADGWSVSRALVAP